MKIALVSLNQVWEDKKENLFLCEQYIQKASQSGVDLIVFPEMTLTGFSNNIDLISENLKDSTTIKEFSFLAKRANISIIFGMVILNKDKALNKAIFLNNSGEILDYYAKIHPFSFAGEDKYFSGGDKLGVVSFEDMNIGLTICYDLRFPELYSSLAKKCDLILNIANWPSKRVEHWNILLRARAIENQIFVAGVNRIGVDGNGLEYIESSSIFNANGEELKCEKSEEMKIYTIDKSWTKEFKSKFNTTDDRKIEFYRVVL